MYRSHNCGELRINDLNKEVKLSGWVQKVRDKGFIMWVDLRDRYGVTQLIFDQERTPSNVIDLAKTLGREFVINITGSVIERNSKNDLMSTGDIEVLVSELKILNSSITPPFTIEDESDGGEELRMKYRYLDIRREPVKNNLILRHKITQQVRTYLSDNSFIEVETPYLIKSTPEGARDFVVPSRMNPGEFYALPQSPQTFKQLLMVAGMDKYFQIVKCFRDEDLRADRQPEFTQIDCEMAFVSQEDILNTFEDLVKHLFQKVKNIKLDKFPVMTYDDAVQKYGTDKPDLRYNMKFVELNDVAKNRDFNVFNNSELIVGFLIEGGNSFTRKDIDKYTDWVKRPQIGAGGLAYLRIQEDGTYKSSVDKFYDQSDLENWANKAGAKQGDILFILSGDKDKVRTQLGALRVHVADNLGLKNPEEFKPLWVVDFPLLEWDEEAGRFFSMHHPFTTPSPSSLEHLESTDQKTLENLTADAYDLVINGVEIGGGSIRIAQRPLQERVFRLLGFTDEEAQDQFGFLLNAFRYGAPPHGGIALGFDRLVALMDGSNSIRDYIAFPKNNQARDVMLDAPSRIDKEACATLGISVHEAEE